MSGFTDAFYKEVHNSSMKEISFTCLYLGCLKVLWYNRFEDFLQMKEFFSGERLLPRKPTYYHTLEEPEVWFPPELVWEIRGAGENVTKMLLSPHVLK